MVKKITYALTFCLCTAVATAEPIKMSALDFVLDWQELEGKTVSIEDCHAAEVNAERGTCYVYSGDSFIGFYLFFLEGLAREERKRLLVNCASSEENPDHCVFDISGKVAVFADQPNLQDVNILRSNE